ncbi:hypothetical protein ACFLV6_00560 [Chloroflexota bacterium]
MDIKGQSRKVYGKQSHWWPDEMPPFLVAAALIGIVLENCEKARPLYNEIKEAWGKPGCQMALNEVNLPLGEIIALAAGNQEVELPDKLNELYDRYKDSPDCKYLIERVKEFIKIGFNRDQGQQKVLPSKETWLSFTIGLKALVDFSVEKPDWETFKQFEFGGKTYDFSIIFDGESNNQHRRNVDLFQSIGWHRKLDKTIRQAAFRWYQCRVVNSRIEDFLSAEAKRGNLKLDLKNIQKEIRIVDDATGYEKRKQTKIE